MTVEYFLKHLSLGLQNQMCWGKPISQCLVAGESKYYWIVFWTKLSKLLKKKFVPNLKHIDRKLGIKGKDEYEYVHAHALTQTYKYSFKNHSNRVSWTRFCVHLMILNILSVNYQKGHRKLELSIGKMAKHPWKYNVTSDWNSGEVNNWITNKTETTAVHLFVFECWNW